MNYKLLRIWTCCSKKDLIKVQVSTISNGRMRAPYRESLGHVIQKYFFVIAVPPQESPLLEGIEWMNTAES